MTLAETMLRNADSRLLMDPDFREMLEFAAKFGRAAERLLEKSFEPEAAQANPAAITLVKAAAPAPEPRPPVAIPKGFAIGQAQYEDRFPQSKRWYTPHALEMMCERYGVQESIAYKTLQYVMMTIQTNKSEMLYEINKGGRFHVHAVDLFGEVAFVATDVTHSTIVTFYPREARNNNEIQRHPHVRARLEGFEAAMQLRAIQRRG